MLRAQFIVALPLLFVAAACSSQGGDAMQERTGSVKQPEAWSPRDNPSLFTSNLEKRLSNLPRIGEAAKIPWAGSYWPTFKDGINYRWDGPNSDSPAKKYELAFGRSGVEDAVSRTSGVDAHGGRRSCTKSSQCDYNQGEACAKRTGESRGRCIPTWFGICHAWAPAAILVPEPQHDVVKNGVTFHVPDIKALVSLVHESVTTKFVSLRCNAEEGDMDPDEYGRPRSDCRDTNPGTLHILLANYLGIRKQSFVEDRTYDYQVWNQPLRNFKVLSTETVTSQEANALVVGDSEDASSDYLFNPKAVTFVHVKTEVTYITESGPEEGHLASKIDEYTRGSRYDYVLELDGNGEIIGGEWVGRSKSDHPDFLWLPVRQNGGTVAGGAISAAEVKELADLSVAPE
ncbi:hypothetical protein LVJ94_36270 [Pendulispora rubella]|uniref:Transglutaminase elicitor n=1 Tax=Pendulispora rubella TaxID=2741070 RepID=A0ABZ2KUJ4_9BACT